MSQASSSPFPANAGQKPGALEIWRIENLKPVAVDAKLHGTFHSGDSYILLRTFIKGTSTNYDLHFWLGEKSSQDERGAAAILSITLDDQLGGKPVQHREVQFHESPLFLSYFPAGIVYADGGVASAFNHVDPTAYRPRLFHCKGKRHVRCSQVELKAASLNEGDVFILDAGLNLYQWNGKSANKFEKTKGLEIVSKIKDDERGGKAKVTFLDSGVNDDDANFWKLLPGGKSAVRSADSAGDDEAVQADAVKLFRVSDASGSLQVTPVASGRLEKSHLDDSDAFIVDSGTAVYVWVGKGASKDERKKALSMGEQYLSSQGRPVWTPLSRIVGGGETPAFKALFAKWEEPKVIHAETERKSSPKTHDTSALYKQKAVAEEKVATDPTGQIEIWRIEKFDKKPLPKEQFGHFYSGDSYIVLYTYKQGSKILRTIYFWQGSHSSIDEKATSALLTVELDKQYGGDPVEVRVVQGKEPNSFLALFKGKFVVHQGGVDSGFHNAKHSDSNASAARLYHVRGTSPLNTHAVQVDAAARSLNSNDTFIALNATTAYVWFGLGSNNDEKSFAKGLAPLLAQGRKIVEVNERNEDAGFWATLGGKAEYASSKELLQTDFEARLFETIFTATGFALEEIVNYHQDDLRQDAILILDAREEVFVWVGHESNKEARDHALQAAVDFVKRAPDGRSADTPVFKVSAGNEPPNFVAHFHPWDSNKANDFTDPYLKKLGKLGAAPSSSSPAAGVERITASSLSFADPNSKKYGLEELKKSVPAGVDPSHKELYLADAEFKATFGVDQAGFAKLQAWKQTELKKKAGLF